VYDTVDIVEYDEHPGGEHVSFEYDVDMRFVKRVD
jgi:hypothetical protein